MLEKTRDCLKRFAAVIKRNIPEIAVALVCLAVLGGFVSMKEGFHMDELLSYELSNAEYNPWIVPTQPEGRLAKFIHNEIDGDTWGETLSNLVTEAKDVLQNRGNSKLLSYKADVYEEPVWITAEQFQDYITVGAGDAFNYLSVYFNVKDDNHPPLHFMLLHTVSSIFRRKAEAWMGCLINLAAVGAILVLLIKIGRLLAEVMGMGESARAAGLLCALFYGISAGAVSTTLLIRMYGLVTLWCVAYFWLVIKKWRNREFDRHNLWLILITAFGFWTQYFFLFYCILLAAVAAACLLRSRRIRELGCFVRSMLTAAFLGLAGFPFAIADVFSSGRGVEALGNLSEGFSGYGLRLSAFLKIVGDRTFSLWFWVMLFLMLLLSGIGRAGLGKNGTKHKETVPGNRLAEENETAARDRRLYLWMLLFPVAGYFLLAARMSPYLVDRYMMPVFPFVILTGMLAMLWLLQALKKEGPGGWSKGLAGMVCGLALAFQLWGLLQYDGSYLYRGYGRQEKLAEEYADYSCLCVYTGVGYYENLKEFTNYEKTLLLTPEELENRKDKESIAAQDKLAVLIKEEVDYTQVLTILTQEYGFVMENGDWVCDGPYGDTICLMRKDS